MVHLVKKLIAEGCEVQIWDENVSLGQLIGSNRDFIEAQIPHIGTLLRNNLRNVLGHADVVVLGTGVISREKLLNSLEADQYLIDLSNLAPALKESAALSVIG